MTEYIAQCRWASGDRITAYRSGGSVRLGAFKDEELTSDVCLRAADARTFARGILALADEVDGGEAKAEPAPDSRPQVGDLLRVTKDYPRHAPAKAGDIIKVSALDYDNPLNSEDYIRYLADGDEPGDYEWYVPLSAVEPVDVEPEPPIATVTTPTREAYLHQAAELLGANPSASDLIELADYLAGEGA